MLTFALRTDKCVTEVKAWLATHCFGGFGVREVSGENEHWHWLLDAPEEGKKIQNYRVSLSRAIPDLKGNGAYSLTEVKDRDKYIRYCCKGASSSVGPEVVWAHGMLFSADRWWVAFHEAYWRENSNLRAARAMPAARAVILKLKNNSVRWQDREAIGREYIKELVARDKPINLFAVKSVVNLLQIQLCPDDQALENLVQCI